MPTDTAPATTLTTVTPKNEEHYLFGKILCVIKQDAEEIIAEIKDGIHWIEAKFKRSEVIPAELTPTPAPAEPAPAPVADPTPAPAAPVATTPPASA